MTTRPKISAIVHTYNSERTLDTCLTALHGFDEILVVDMESTDSTAQIAEKHGARFIVKERAEHRIPEAYRDFAIHAAEHDWVIVVDSDEVVPAALRDYLYEEIARDPSPRAYIFPIKNYFMGRWMRCYYPDYILRFFNRAGAHWPYQIHSRPSHEGPEIRIPASRTDLAFVHLANESMQLYLTKMNGYTDREMDRRRASFRAWRILTDPPYRFFKTYVLKGGWRMGWPGFIHACLDGFYRFSLLSKLYAERTSYPDITRDTQSAIKSRVS